MALTLDQLESAYLTKRAAADRRAAAAGHSLRSIVAAGRARPGGRLTQAEDARAAALAADLETARGEAAEFDAHLASCRSAAADEARIIAGQAAGTHLSTGTARPAYDRVMRVGREERTYHRGNDPRGSQFLLDVARQFLYNDPEAQQRLVRHMAEERIERPGYLERTAGDTLTSNWAGLVVPAFLTDLTAEPITALRPFADLCCVPVDLPPGGMSVNFSKVTTGASVALQATELTGVSATSMDDTIGTAAVQTAAGQQTISRQAVDRGIGIDETVMRDLMRKYATALDSTLINQATTGLQAVSQLVTYTSASPTGPEFWPFIYQAASKLEAALLGVAYPSHVVMHSRRWNWLASQVSSTWPIVNSAGVPAQSAAYSLTTEYGPSVRAVLASGLKVVVDNNVPTVTGGTQDEVYVVAAGETMYLAEDPNAPVMIRAEQPAAPNLGLLMVVYGYFSYFTRYANPASKIVGTGTAAPAGF